MKEGSNYWQFFQECCAKKWAMLGELEWKVILSFVLLYHRQIWHPSPFHCWKHVIDFSIGSISRYSGTGMAHSRSNDTCWIKPAKFSIFTHWSLHNQKHKLCDYIPSSKALCSFQILNICYSFYLDFFKNNAPCLTVILPL